MKAGKPRWKAKEQESNSYTPAPITDAASALALAAHLKKKNAPGTRDTLYEKYPPAYTARGLLDLIGEQMCVRLRAFGFTFAQINRMTERLESIPGNVAANEAARAVYFRRQYIRASKEGKADAAAVYALWTGIAAQRCESVHDRRDDGKLGRLVSGQTFADRDAILMAAVRAKQAEHRAEHKEEATLKDLYDATAAVRGEMSSSRFAAVLKKHNWRDVLA
jgi:hypothetical protein